MVPHHGSGVVPQLREGSAHVRLVRQETKTAALGVPVRARDRWLFWWMTTTQANTHTRARLIRISQAV